MKVFNILSYIKNNTGLANREQAASAISSRKAAVIAGILIIFLVSINLLVTRQVLPAYKDIEVIIFVLTVTIGYGIGSWILLRYTERVIREIRAKSRFIKLMHWTVTVVQYSLLGILLIVLLSNNPTSTRVLSHTVFAVSSIFAISVPGNNNYSSTKPQCSFTKNRHRMWKTLLTSFPVSWGFEQFLPSHVSVTSNS
ncbi:hypothetical protein BH18THE2_BH18THE2_08880 [soil metagenome]